tara:strand:- start:1443 stop:1787 length:345 start_codon:yes stop_codon:yes gene_type:complete
MWQKKRIFRFFLAQLMCVLLFSLSTLAFFEFDLSERTEVDQRSFTFQIFSTELMESFEEGTENVEKELPFSILPNSLVDCIFPNYSESVFLEKNNQFVISPYFKSKPRAPPVFI